MNKISLHTNTGTGVTILENSFIDQYMPDANGSFVKVYIYLMRCISDPSSNLTIAFLADKLDETEKDIERALRYWEKAGLLSIDRDTSGQIVSILFLSPNASSKTEESQEPSKEASVSTKAANVSIKKDSPIIQAVPKTFDKPNYSDAQIEQLTAIDEVQWIMNTLEQYLERLLKPTDVQLVLYLYESIGFPADLILYLYEYCVSKNKKSASYIETVALAWAEEGIDTVEKAEASTATYNNNYNAVNKAFGLNRAPGSIEKKFMHRWFHTYAFEIPIIEEACNRTMLATGKPDFKYADRIVENWSKKGVTSLNDIKKLDEEHAKNSAVSAANKQNASAASTNTAKASNNKFNAFPQRKYTEDDFRSMEQRLLNKQ